MCQTKHLFPIGRSQIRLFFLLLGILLLALPAVSRADDKPPPGDRGFELDLGEEYTQYNRERGGKPYGHGGTSSEPFWRRALLYLPNRIVDFFDIFRVDLGVGPSYGGVIRVTKYAQAGYRDFAPGSLRLGLRGRKSPIFWESKKESGLGDNLGGRGVTTGEVGFGLDLFAVGAYFGLSFDQLWDFAAGIAGVDPKGDDF